MYIPVINGYIYYIIFKRQITSISFFNIRLETKQNPIIHNVSEEIMLLLSVPVNCWFETETKLDIQIYNQIAIDYITLYCINIYFWYIMK